MAFICEFCNKHARPCAACEGCSACCDAKGCRFDVDEEASESRWRVTPRYREQSSSERFAGVDIRALTPVHRSPVDEILDKARQFAFIRGVTSYGAIMNKTENGTEIEISVTIQEDDHGV